MKAIRQDVRALKRAFAMNRDQHVMTALLVELRDDKVAVTRNGLCMGIAMVPLDCRGRPSFAS